MIFGTAGHVDHGKSSLIKALTGVDPTHLPEEKKRALTIDLGFVNTKICDIAVSFIDVPGHENLVRNMISGSFAIDGALFVIDSSVGVMPQTKEHAFILKVAGVEKIIAVLTKIDKVSQSELKNRHSEVVSFFDSYGFENVLFVNVSIFDNGSLESLKNLITSIGACSKKSDKKPFRMFVDRNFSLKGAGTIVTGTVLSGRLSRGDILYVYPICERIRVRHIQSGNDEVPEIFAGCRTGLNLSNISAKDVERGSVLYHEGSFALSKRFGAEISYFENYKLKNNGTYNIFIGSSKLRATYIENKNEFILDKAFPIVCGDVFFIRGSSPETTIAGGKISAVIDKNKIADKISLSTNKTEYVAPDTDVFFQILDKKGEYVGVGEISSILCLDTPHFDKIINHLVSNEEIILLDKYVMRTSVFRKYADIAKNIILSDGFIDLNKFRENTKLSRNIASAILDKGDSFNLWINKDNLRY